MLFEFNGLSIAHKHPCNGSADVDVTTFLLYFGTCLTIPKYTKAVVELVTTQLKQSIVELSSRFEFHW